LVIEFTTVLIEIFYRSLKEHVTIAVFLPVRESLFQIPLGTAQEVQFHFQLTDDYSESLQLNPLESLHTLFQAELKSLKNLCRRQLWGSRHAPSIIRLLFA
jgi:hypothetical protein